MPKVYIINESKHSLGGGWSFIRNFEKGYGPMTHPKTADIFLIPSASMVSKQRLRDLVAMNPRAKVVLRVDNALKNSRNRNTGSSRMMLYADMADAIIFQSEWAKGYLAPWLGGPDNKHHVILNGSDSDIFKPEGDEYEIDYMREWPYLYVRQNRDETKGWHLAWYSYQMIQREEPNAKLWIVGNFSPELVEHNFDFFMDERINYFGQVNSPEEMAKIYRSASRLLYPYFNDACSNVFNEAMLCGLEPAELFHMGRTGGAPEQIKAGGRTIDDMMVSYKQVFEGLI